MTLTLKVEVAFNAGYGTAAGSRTWTDISSYVELDDGIDIQVGRRDEFSVAEPNTLSLTLDNSDGRFTPERSSSPYYPNVKLYRPIRVTATLPDASTSVRFLGYVTEWPTAWPGGSSGYAQSRLTASSRMSRLGSTTQLRSMLEQEILAAPPSAHFPLSEAAGSTVASDIIGNSTPLSIAGSGADVVFGNGVGPVDGVTAVQFASGKYLSGNATVNPTRMEMWAVLPSAAPASRQIIAAASGGLVALTLETSGKVSAYFALNNVGGLTETLAGQTSTSMLGGLHQFAFGYSNGGAAFLYADGVLIASTAVSAGIGNETDVWIGAGPAGSSPFTGTIAQLSLFPDLANVAARYAVGSGTISESTAARLRRIAGYGDVLSAETDATGTVLVGAQDITGKSVLDALRDVEASEASVLYDERDGTLTLDSRNVRYQASTAFTLDASAQHLGSDFKPVYDETGLKNDVTASGPTATARFFLQSSIDDFGPANATPSTLATSADEPLMLAGWMVNNYSQPRTRVGTLTVDVLPFASGTPSVMNIAGVSVGSLIGVSNLPTQALASSASYFVEGYTEHFAVESWVITFNVSPSAPFLGTWVLDSGTRSQLDSTTLLAL